MILAKLARATIKGLFDEILREILCMLKEQVLAFNETFGNTPESRLQVISGTSST